MSSRILYTLAVVVCATLSPSALFSQTAKRPLITENVDNTRLHTLSGNTRPEAVSSNDLGAVSDDLAMDHMQMQLQRSAAEEQALQRVIDQLHNPKSPTYHKWLTSEQFGQLYGPSQQDVSTVTSWLQSQGFTVNSASPTHMTIDFSGKAGQVQQAFHTSIHHLNVNGVRHIANMSDPQIPAALAPVVAGVISLHDFTPHAMKKSRPKFTYTSQGYTNQAVTPSDLATIYNLTPLFGAGVTGMGQTIAVVEDSNLYNSADWDTFRSTFGLSQYSSGSLITSHPSGAAGNCSDPGTSSGDDEEATLDAEYATAAAPGAAIVVASCADTRATFGGIIALQNLINSSTPPNVVSISYGQCEAENGAASNAAFNSVYQQAVAEGVSIFVAAGDEGAASCDAGATGASHGIGVSSWSSTPYNVAVGGTDFGDSYANTNSTYWSSTNSSTYGSALSYVPEIPWNDSCASGLLASALGYTATYGDNGLCGSSTAKQDQLLEVAAGSGGPSGCATGSPSAQGIVGGTCQGYAKPSWQSGLAGNPGDGVRDIPDVSLFAGSGVWGHYYVVCFSDLRNGGSSCAGDPSTWAGGGGTSFASPIMAGIQALVNQSTGSSQGNPNYVYYQIAAAGNNTCNSSNGDPGAGSCVFHNVTQGDIDVNCDGSQNCFGATETTTGGGFGHRGGGGGQFSSANGALSSSDQSYAPAFITATGWNFATGIGSVNALNLVNNWITGQ